MRREFTMAEEDMKAILEACRPVPYMVFGGIEPRSPQENANDAWCALGRKMGFDGMTVEPTGRGDRIFTAEVVEPPVDPNSHEGRLVEYDKEHGGGK